MKTFICLLILGTVTNTFAALDMKPGLWKIEVKMNSEGKVVNIQSEMQKAMANMSPEHKKKMIDMMGKMNTGAGISQDGDLQVCYSKEMLNNELSIMEQKDKKCKISITEKSSKKVVANFSCEDGTKGTSLWKITNSSAYTGNVKTEKSGKKSEIIHNGKFVSSDCGNIKPKQI